MLGCTSGIVSYARELTSVSMCYSQGDGFNTSHSLSTNAPCRVSLLCRVFADIEGDVWILRTEGDVLILRSEGDAWLHFWDRFICKGVDIGIYVLLTGGWI